MKATVSGYLVGLDSTLKYHNEGDNPVEVLFRFPLEESFAVVGLEVSNSGEREREYLPLVSHAASYR